jgi:hypothetical protein
MPSSKTLTVELDRGSDFAVQLEWMDDDGYPVPVKTPAACKVVDSVGAQVMEFVDSGDPTLTAMVSPTTSGVIQLTAPKSVTTSLPIGRFAFDMFVTTDTTDEPFSSGQYRKVFSGWMLIRQSQSV